VSKPSWNGAKRKQQLAHEVGELIVALLQAAYLAVVRLVQKAKRIDNWHHLCQLSPELLQKHLQWKRCIAWVLVAAVVAGCLAAIRSSFLPFIVCVVIIVVVIVVIICIIIIIIIIVIVIVVIIVVIITIIIGMIIIIIAVGLLLHSSQHRGRRLAVGS
jgi:lipopolysaccharide export LptBFGC system permease protein LptF